MSLQTASPAAPQLIHWEENGAQCSAVWHSEAGMPPPKRVVIADDRINADMAYSMACEGTALLWRGDFQNARQLLQALARRIDHKGRGSKKAKPARAPATPTEAFHLHRQAQSQRARTLAMLLIPFEAGYTIPLRRAPDVQLACNEAYGRFNAPFIASLRELLGLIGAHEWRRTGVEIPALQARIHPHYGVFSPVRGEYVELVAKTPLPRDTTLAFDIGAGTGVLSAVLARRGIGKVVATDMDQRALSCARENLARLDLDQQVELQQADLFPAGRAPLVVCNPPWVPARPSSSIEYAVYDPDSRMLRGFLAGLTEHLTDGGEGWLILSDLAEHLGLRPREQLLGWIAEAGLKVLDRHDVRPLHPRASDASDPLHAARSAEVTSLWRLAAA
ncbi:methyltransferase [Duganella qianjiadongensis]|uniref:Methyltransferase n=1 Tax=Duganella qianjiadongensis TaxID=2692176 RepID=A0ABW9VPB3_9BURK|nr:class I SAM-dependent methyltransferase [Duganella qianjiadongensis]MYM41406.1 methyltransferase [Duganella qianjiadongensis]